MNLEILLKILFENTLLLGIFFALGGILKLFIYYKLFGILIFEFFDLKEVLSLFANNLIAYFAIIFFILGILIVDTLSFGFEVIWLPIIFTILSVLYFFLRPKIFLYETILQIFLFWGLYLIIVNSNRYINLDQIENDSLGLFFLALILFSLALFSVFNGFNEYYKVKFKNHYANTKIEIKGKCFTSDNFKYYIGKTDKYIFIHDESTNSTEVIPASNIDKITFTKV